MGRFSRSAPPVLLSAAVIVALASAVEWPAEAAAPRPEGDGASWIGQTVMPKRSGPVASHSPRTHSVQPAPDPDEPPAVELSRSLHAACWVASAERGTRVMVFDWDGTECWVEKDLLLRLDEAVPFYTKAIEADAVNTDPLNLRGWAKHMLGHNEEAVQDFDEYLKRVAAPGNGRSPIPILSNRGLVLAEMGKYDAAFQDLDPAVLAGHMTALLNRGWAHHRKGDYKAADADYAALLKQLPNDVRALDYSALLRATCPDGAFRDGKEAVKLARRACDQTVNRDGRRLATLAAAHAEAGEFFAAMTVQKIALQDPAYAKTHDEEGRLRLQLYRDHKPLRTDKPELP